MRTEIEELPKIREVSEPTQHGKYFNAENNVQSHLIESKILQKFEDIAP